MEITHFERMSLNDLCSNSLILTREQAFRGKKRNQPIGACLLSHSYLFSVFLSNSFFFLSFLLYFLPLCCSLMGLSCSLLLSCCSSFSFLSPFLSVHGGRPFYTACCDGFLLFYPLIAFVWVWVSFQTTHWSVSCLATTTYLCRPCYIPLPNNEPYFVCLLTVAFQFG